jgi:hypothetical protein
LPFHSHTTCCPSPCLGHYPQQLSTMATPSPLASRLGGDPAFALMRRTSTGRCLVRFLHPPHWWSLTVESVASAATGMGLHRWKLRFNQFRLHHAYRTCGTASTYLR